MNVLLNVPLYREYVATLPCKMLMFKKLPCSRAEWSKLPCRPKTQPLKTVAEKILFINKEI